MVSIDIVHLLELIKIDIYEAKDSGFLLCQLDRRLQMFIQREAVMDFGKQVKLTAMHQVGIEPPCFNGQSRQARTQEESFLLVHARWCIRIDCGDQSTQRM